ncbi:hypothetical protein MAC_03594 [Metarhizium acridum CQMa 102]|uniref:Uncharacterized protein n=1 Tax=Metarhizium acridum (strain CQMa 102) TaxID=655827 RepID=E9E146_METAQ|nr:uncharacterized protein MAC_03594 [Metarhizium acridum CQMa 102]EFY90348.1 hypothetical protein MAC_03594 [Metarhizium acridum CQMa 102]
MSIPLSSPNNVQSRSPQLIRHLSLPNPNIHPDLLPPHYRQTSVQNPFIPPPRNHVLPKDRVALHRPKRHALLILLIAIYKFTPLAALGSQEWEIRSATNHTLRLDVSKDGGGPVAAQRSNCMPGVREPIRVEVISLRRRVFHKLDGFHVGDWHVEALEVKRAAFDTTDSRGAVDRCRLRGADGVDGLRGIAGYVRVFEGAVAVGVSMSRHDGGYNEMVLQKEQTRTPTLKDVSVLRA